MRKRLDLPGLVMEGFDMPDIGSKFDMTMYVAERGKQIELTLVYNTDLFYPERMAELLAQYQNLLTQIVSNPDQIIQEFSLETERATAVLPNPEHPLSSIWLEPVPYTFSKQAKRVPDNIALVDKFDSWTYRELDICTNQLAHYLQENGLGPQDVVAGVCAPKCRADRDAAVDLEGGLRVFDLGPSLSRTEADGLFACRPAQSLAANPRRRNAA